MSLDVYLEIDELVTQPAAIYVRENGQMREVTRAEWDERFPGTEPHVRVEIESNTVYSANITHNLGRMASEAGIYEVLWRPEEIGVERAGQLVGRLAAGLALLEQDPERFKALNPENGWGDYEGLVDFTRRYLAACEQWRDAKVKVWR